MDGWLRWADERWPSSLIRLVVVLGSAFDIKPVMDRLEDGERFGEQCLVDRCIGPGHPFLDVLGVGRPHVAGGHIFIGDRILKRELRDVDPFRLAMQRRAA